MPVLLAGFLPYFQELLSRVERNRSAGISDPALGQEAQEYAGALWNGLMAPSYEGTVDAYKAHFESLKQALDQKTIQNLEETLGLTAEFFPERIPPEAPPRFVLFWNELMSDQEAAEILPYNRYNNRFGPPSISLWALTVGNPNAMPYVEDLPEHPFFGGTDRTSQGVIAGEKMVLIQMTQIYRFLHQRGREARASAGLEERRYRLEGPSGPIDIGVDVSPNTIAPAPVAFVFHGWTGSRNEPHILAVRKLLATMGYLVVAPDFRNHGPKNGNRSGGELDQLALAGQMEDLVRVIQFVREKIPDADLSRTVVGGHSLGGWTARQAAEQIARGTPGFEGMGLMAVADLSGILRPQDLGLPNADALKGFEGYDPLENLRRIPDGVRYLYVVGADDPRVSPGSAEAQLFLQAVEARGVPPLILSGVAHALADEKGAPAGTLQTVLLHLKERIPTLGLPEEEFTAGEPVRENTPYSTFQIGGRILLPGEKSGRNPGWARIITRKYPDGVSIETHQMDRHGRTVFNTGTSDTIQQLARRGAFYKPALKKPVLPPAVGLEENDYENRQTDPQQHNEQNFTYFVHMTSGMDAALVGSFLKTTGRGEGMLRHPEREHLISASILHRDPDSQVLGTYRSQRVGYILRVPQRNIVWVAPFDFISDRGERYLKQMLAERDQQGLLPFRELIEASQRYQTANEALIMGTTPDGQSRVETVGMVVLDTDSESWEQSWDEQLFDEARKAGLPIVTIRPEQRQNRLAQPIGAPSQAELDAFVKSLGVKSEVDLPAAQARLDAWLREQDRLYWEKRESYLPAVFRTQHAGLEENEYVWRPISPDQFTDDKTQEAVGRLREWLENPRGVSARAMAADLSALVGRAGLGTDYWRGSLQYQLESTMLLIQRTGGLQVLFEEGKYWNNLYDIKRFEKLIKTLGALFQKPVSTAQDAADALRALGRVRLTKLGTTTESLGFGYDTDRVGEFVGHLKKGRGIHWMGSFVEGFPGPDSDVDFRAHFPTNDFWIIHSGLLLVQAGLRQKDTGILKAHPYPYDVFGDPSQNKVPFPLDPNKLFIERDGAVYWNGDWLAELFLEMQSLRAQIRGEQAQNPLSEVEIAQQAAILLQQRLTGSHTAGLEEQGIGQVMAVLDEAAPQGEGILVLEARVLGRAGLEELVGRMGPQLGRRVILFGKESAAAKEAAARSGVLLVDSDDPADLALQLTGLEERVGRIGYVGDRKTANWLAKVLPSSMEVTPLDPAATLPELFRFLGYPASFLGQINASGLEESLERSRAA